MVNNTDYTQLTSVLAWLAGPAGMLAWLIAWSNFLKSVRENEPEELSALGQWLRAYLDKGANNTPAAVQFLHLVGSLIVPALAALVTSLVPAEFILSLQPTYAWLAMFYLAYVGSQVWYEFTKAKSPTAPAVVQNVVNEAAKSGAKPTTNEVTMNVTSTADSP